MSERATPLAADLYGDLLGADAPARAARWRDYLPGLSVTAVAALAAAYISEHYGAPLMLMGLLFGLAFNFANADPKLQPGLGLASRALLRWGIVLLGARVTFDQIAGLGFASLAAVAAIIGCVILTGMAVARWMRFGNAYGVLGGGAVAICGASAALAFAALLGEKRISQAQLTMTLVCIATASAIAMSVYPPLVQQLGLTDRQAGFVMGAAIHDVAQSLGAGFSISSEAGSVATVVKLTRVALMVPTLAIVSLFVARGGRSAASAGHFPWFVLGFLALVAVNSLIPVPPAIGKACAGAATALLLLAVVATGIRSPMQQLLVQGWRASVPVAMATIISFMLACGAALLLLGN